VTTDEPRFKLRVNGREREFTQAELIERAGKVEAADEYLVEAARIRRDLEQQASNTQAADANPSGQSAAESLEKRRALVRAIQMGTEEEAMAALEELQQPARPALNAVDLARTVDERLTFKDAVGRFESEYQDVIKDPVLRTMAFQADQSLIAQGDTRPYLERYRAIGNDIRAWIAQFKAPTATAATASAAPTGREQRKAAAPTPPKAAQARAPAASRDDEGEESVTDVIANIAKARGGPQWLRS
jgi:hypothetical protein